MNTFHVDDFVVLGRTIPEDSKKYGQRVCMAGYSPDCNQFLRVYPLMVPVGANVGTNDFRARYTYRLNLRRNTSDTRMESWRVLDELNPTATPWSEAKEVKKPAVLDWLQTKRVPSIGALNVCRLSLGVLFLPADRWKGVIVEKDEPVPPEHHRSLFEDLEDQAAAEPAIGNVRYAPYIHFDDDAGFHKLQVREWGAYRLLAKPEYAEKPEVLWGASGYRSGKDLWIVVGNMTNHRNNWLVIKTFEAEKAQGPGLFDDVTTEGE